MIIDELHIVLSKIRDNSYDIEWIDKYNHTKNIRILGPYLYYKQNYGGIFRINSYPKVYDIYTIKYINNKHVFISRVYIN